MLRFVKVDNLTLPRRGKPFLAGILPGDLAGLDRIRASVIILTKTVRQYDTVKAIQEIGFR